jgi:Na+/proline symporter
VQDGSDKLKATLDVTAGGGFHVVAFVDVGDPIITEAPTFSGTLNAAQAYIVNDIYLKYIDPHASTKKVMTANYLVGIVVVAIGVTLGFFAKDVNSVLQWIVAGLYGGYVSANVFKWYWWRFNAHGFFWGMFAGVAGALVFSKFFTGIEFLYYFPLLFLISIATNVIPPSNKYKWEF